MAKKVKNLKSTTSSKADVTTVSSDNSRNAGTSPQLDDNGAISSQPNIGEKGPMDSAPINGAKPDAAGPSSGSGGPQPSTDPSVDEGLQENDDSEKPEDIDKKKKQDEEDDTEGKEDDTQGDEESAKTDEESPKDTEEEAGTGDEKTDVGKGEAGTAEGEAGLAEGEAVAETEAVAGEVEAVAAGGEAAAAGGTAEATAGATAATGGTCWIVALVIVAIILIIVVIFVVVMMCQANRGDYGKATPIPAGKDSVQVKNILSLNSKGAKTASGMGISGYDNIGLNDEDKKFIEEGNIDKRLAEAMKYLADKHLSLGFSHVVSGYSDMPEENTESGAQSNDQVTANVSAHKLGTASDLATIDFVYNTHELGFCCDHCPKFDVVYYGDAGMKIGEQANNQEFSVINPEDLTTDNLLDYVSASEGIVASIDELQTNFDQMKATLEDPEFLKGLTNEQLTALKEKLAKINISGPDNITLDLSKIEELYTNNQENIVNLKGKINKTIEALKTTSMSAEEQRQALEAIGKMEIMISYDTQKWNQYADYATKLSDSFKTDLSYLKSFQGLTIDQINPDDLNWSLTNITSNLDGTIYTQNISAIQDIAKINEQFGKITAEWDQVGQMLGGLNIGALTPDAAFNELLKSQTWIQLPTDLGSLSGLGDLANLDLSKVGDLGGLLTLDKIDILGNLGGLPEMGQVLDIGGLGDIGSLGSLGSLANLGLGAFGGGSELLRLRCSTWSPAPAGVNTTWKVYPAKAIPIKVSWQDKKPNVKYVSGDSDDSLSTDPRVYYSVYQPEARRKVHQAIAELLQYPILMKEKYYYRINQLITFSHERDVQPFWDLLKEIYGGTRRANFGLFAMPESWSQVHIAY